MIYAKMVGDLVVITTLEDGGKELVETTAPSSIPDNYKLEYHWEEAGSRITQVWTLVPIGGTEQDAMLTLAKIQAQGLTDKEALQVPMLYDEWYPGRECVKDERIRWKGVLYRVSKSHTAQDIYPPDAEGVESLYTKVMVDPETGYEEWKQPSGEHDAYSKGDIVKHNEKLWISTVEGTNTNTWEPGVYGWEEYTEPSA